ncbi:hypothetical protein KY290_005045 [Solanum tuberosum]|uniref:Uncharacterized protein n=1 Tax=Solanum tuberosum TaxID=4113 RepID=A0ABQ7WET5_SOLTU|nr:hypothetical protein KY290_005045 [Solanum tuberosum]
MPGALWAPSPHGCVVLRNRNSFLNHRLHPGRSAENPFVLLLVSATVLKLAGRILTLFGKVSAINGFDESLLATV